MSGYPLIFIFMIALLPSCIQKPVQAQHPKLDEIVDKGVLLYVDSLGKLDNAALSAHYKDYYEGISKKLHEFPPDRDTPSHALLALRFGIILNFGGVYDSSIRYTQDALSYFELHPYYVKQLLICYGLLGLTLNNTREHHFKANYYATKAASICLLPGMDTVLKTGRRCQCLYVAAETNMLCQQKEQALRFAEHAYALIAPQKDSSFSHYMRSVSVLAGAYIEIRQYDSARKYLTIAQNYADARELDTYQDDVKELKMKYFLAVGKYDSSLKYLSLIRPPDSEPGYLFYKYCYQVRLYTLLHRPAQAARSLALAERLIKGRTDDDESVNFHRNKARYLSLYGDRNAAEKSLLQYDSISREFYRKDRLKMFLSIESEYDLADKQKNLERLYETNKKTTENIRQKNKLLLISVLGILVLALVILSLLLLTRQRKLVTAGQLIRSQRDKILLEQRLFRTQMEPHFIFSTLSSMQNLVRNHENGKAILYLNQFARLLRTSLENSQADYVPATEEIEALRDYLSLQAIRFDDRFDYALNTYAGLDDDEIKIPPMLLQPFVERAIYQGMKDLAYKGMISIDINMAGPGLHCVIMDNGADLAHGTDDGYSSTAIHIATKRLEMISKELNAPASFTVSGRPDNKSGTVVTLIIPYRY
ncbi:sensor histidine kinase [Taibaiella koreensis]|uniref:sensor histidine kinase n=1 Tax=Taibaiella koreensis TaxID=1268548 RepID=UPI000E59D7B6|nr:histidine kinase [Taibaiella koreensis]